MSVRVMTKVWDTPCPSHPSKLVLVALADNANDQHFCYPSVETLARKCDMSENGIRGQIRKLEAVGLLTVQRSEGRMSNGYIVLPETLHGVEGLEERNPARRGLNPARRGASTLHGVASTLHGVEPNRKEPSVLEPSITQGVEATQIQTAVAEEIYRAYPLKVGKPAALKAIRKAMTWVSADILLKKTQAYALARNGDTAFCPHPATWFNQARYDDDPKTWTRHAVPAQPQRPELHFEL